MLRVLIVDDDPDKRKSIEDVVYDIVGDSVSVCCAGHYVEACEALEGAQFDLLILDLRLPREAGALADGLMGIEILDRLSDPGRRLLQPKWVVGVTAFGELQSEYSERFASEGWHLLEYSPASLMWRQRLSRIVVHASAADQIEASSELGYRTDLLILTALAHTEQEQVLKLPLVWSSLPNEDDDTVYYSSTLTTEQGQRSVVAASAVRMGMPASTALAMKAICRFRPRFVAMYGVAAGVNGNFGDILIADQSWDYGSGKSRSRWWWVHRFEPAPEPFPLDHYLRSRLAEFRTREDVLENIRSGWKHEQRDRLRAHLGPIASGAAVLQNRWMINAIKRGQRKVIGIEMEAYGVFMAAALSPQPKPKAFVVKSICDFGDHRKGDEHQQYAAYTSASFVHEFARAYL